MNDVEEAVNETRVLRKRKAIAAFQVSDDDGSSDNYEPPKDRVDDCSDDSVPEVYRKAKKHKKNKIKHGEAQLQGKGKINCEPHEDSEDSSSTNKGKKKVKKVTKVKTNQNAAAQKDVKKKSRGRGRPRVRGTKKRKKEIDAKRKENNKESQQSPETSSKRRTGPFSVIGHWYIASGFIKDLTALFTAFDKQDSWRFRAFATCWQNCKFSLILRGRYSFKELLEFSEEICYWTKKFMTPLHTMKWRVGALYALYGLYYKHPFRNFFKIRMDIEEYKNLVSLAGSFQSSAENPDPAYVFFKLSADNALIHVASPDEMGLESCPLERQQEMMNYEMQWVLQEHSANVIFPERERNVQKTLLQEYEKAKSQTLNSGNGQNKAMSYVQPSILSEVDAILAGAHEEKFQQLPATDRQAPADASHSHAASAELSEIGKRKAEVRKKAAALCTTGDFLQRKLLRSPRKRTRKENDQLSIESTSSNAKDDTVEEEIIPYVYCDGNEIKNFQKIMEFMEPQEGALVRSLKSLRTDKNRSQKQQIEESDSQSDGSCEISDSENILLPHESQEQTPEEIDITNINGNSTSLQTIKGRNDRRGRLRKSCSPQKAVESENASESEPHENLQITETLEIFEEISGPDYLSKENELTGNSSLSNEQREPMPDAVKNLNDQVLTSKTYSLDDEQSPPENLQKHKRSEKFGKSRIITPSFSEEGILSGKEDAENTSSVLDKNWSEKSITNLNYQVIKMENVHEINVEGKAGTSKNVHEKVLNYQTISSKNILGDFSTDVSVTTARVLPGVSHDTTLTSFQHEQNQNDSSPPHTISKENKLNSSKEKCIDINNIGTKVLEVEMLACTPKKKNLQSVLKAEGMVYLEINFKENNIIVHSIKFKMSKKDLKTLQSNKEKIDNLTKKLKSTLPLKYKKHELHIKLSVHLSLNEPSETYEEEKSKERSNMKIEKHSKPKLTSQVKHEQRSTSQLVSPIRLGSRSSSEQAQYGMAIKQENTIPQEEPLITCTQKGGSSHATDANDTTSRLSHGTCDDMNLIEKVLQVNMVVNFPKKYKSIPKAKRNAHLNVNFEFEGVMVHNTKFAISENDLETFHTNKKKWKSLKAKFNSLLPPEYQKYKMQLLLNGQHLQSDTENETRPQHSTSGSDSSATLPQASVIRNK